jgi:superfamily II DNA/RNA helicase
VHFDPPNDHKDYVHRSGRTARAGATGTVLALAEPAQLVDLAKLHHAAGVTPITETVNAGDCRLTTVAPSGSSRPTPMAETSPGRGRDHAARPRRRAQRPATSLARSTAPAHLQPPQPGTPAGNRARAGEPAPANSSGAATPGRSTRPRGSAART